MESLRLENQMCFKFYALSRHITSLYQPLLQQLDLTYPQYLVMLVLWEEGKVSVKKIGQLLMLDSGTLTPLLKRLESKGLIDRNRSLSDERIVEVSLTGAGEELQGRAACIPEALYQSIDMDAGELHGLVELLDKLMGKISK